MGVKPTPQTAPGEIASLQIVPAEFAIKAGESIDFKVYGLDKNGHRVKEVKAESWATFIPPTAKVQSTVDATFEGSTLKASPTAKLSAGAFKVTSNGLTATTRGRIVAGYGYSADFDAIELTMKTNSIRPKQLIFRPSHGLAHGSSGTCLKRTAPKSSATDSTISCSNGPRISSAHPT